METVKAALLSNKVSSFLHLIPGTTTVRLDFPTVQILVHGLPTDRSLPDIAQELTTFNTGLALSRLPRWLTPDDRRASKRIYTVVLTLTGSRARDVASHSLLAAFSATFKVEHHLRFNRYTQCHGCHKFGHHTLLAPTRPAVAGVLVPTPQGTTPVPPPPAPRRATLAHTPCLSVSHAPALMKHILPSALSILPLSPVRRAGRMTRCTSTGGFSPPPRAMPHHLLVRLPLFT